MLSANIPPASSKALIGITASGLLFFDGVRRRRLWVRAALHCGVVARLSGARDVELYYRIEPGRLGL